MEFFLDNFLLGVESLIIPFNFLILIIGVVVGIIIGATPGLSPAMGVALLIPFTYELESIPAFILFIAAYQSSNYGGSITAITINAPGTPSSAVTAIDGYELTKKGKYKLALNSALKASVFGGLVGALILILFAIPVAKYAVYLGSAEYFGLALFGLTSVVAFGKKPLKALFAICLGLILSTIGIDRISGEERFTFGSIDFYDGFSLIPVMIGLFALGEVFYKLEQDSNKIKVKKVIENITSETKIKIKNYMSVLVNSSLIGTFIGIIPGAGSTIASFISYGRASKKSENKEEFGKGSVEGICASESANSSSVGGALIPLLSLGIPGSATDAVLLGALSLHSLVPGPELFSANADLVYSIFIALFLANIFIYFFGSIGNKVWIKISKIPYHILAPIIILLCITGTYTLKSSIFDCYICLFFGLVGWIFKKFDYPSAAVVLGLVLGIMLEDNLRRSLMISGYGYFLTRPGAMMLIIFSIISLIYPIFKKIKMKTRS